MSEFSFDDFYGRPQSFLLIGREVLRLGLGVNVEEDDRMMLGKMQVDYPRATGPAFALKGHSNLAQALQARDHVALVQVLQEIILELVEKMVIGDLRHQAVCIHFLSANRMAFGPELRLTLIAVRHLI